MPEGKSWADYITGGGPLDTVSFPYGGGEADEPEMAHTEEFLIAALEQLFNIKHFMSDQGNHIFIDNDPGYQMTRQIWRFTQEELRGKLLEVQVCLSQAQR